MSFSIGIFNWDAECWRWYRSSNNKIVEFDSRSEADVRAIELSKARTGCEVFVATLHSCFKTETEYPQPEPITTTKEITISFEKDGQ